MTPVEVSAFVNTLRSTFSELSVLTARPSVAPLPPPTLPRSASAFPRSPPSTARLSAAASSWPCRAISASLVRVLLPALGSSDSRSNPPCRCRC